MKFRIRCAYCPHVVQLDVASPAIEARSQDVAEFRCPACDSKTIVEMKTRRKSKGKGAKDREARIAAQHAKEVAEAVERNKTIGEQLLLAPGCTCRAHITQFDRSGNNSGHPLATSWSRSASGAMVPGKPEHFHHCPARPRTRPEF